jgi:benzaldehyde dehydrogenase (NAD)
MTGETIYQAAAASVADYEGAIQTAHAAFASWSKTSPSARRLILLRAADIMDTYLAPDSPSRAAEILSAEVRTKATDTISHRSKKTLVSCLRTATLT